jgi:mono/diheme cytochrome c family protein
MRRLSLVALVLVVVGVAAFWLLTIPATIPEAALGPHSPDLANGKVIFFAGGCAECHATPKQEDKTRLGGGLALKSPFGTFYVPNISPDLKDGIGSWSEASFVTALQKGTSPDGRHYYPALPYTSYQRMRREDLRDLFAYLKTLPPVQGKVRDHDLPIYLRWRRPIGAWKILFLDGREFTADTTKPAQWNRGAYLVNGPGHCAECHSPRNFLGGIIATQRFAGGPNPDGEGWIPNITQAGIGDYSEKDIALILDTGETPSGDSVGAQMAAVVRTTGQLSPEDRAAIAAYIKSLPPLQGPKPPE